MVLGLDGGGTLQIREEGERVLLRCEYPMERSGLFKVWIRGEGGERLLGTLVPEGDCLRLCRTFWRGELRREGCWPIISGRCRMVYAFPEGEAWYWEADPGKLVSPEVAQSVEWQGMLCCRKKAGVELALPYQSGMEIPLSALVCLARLRTVQGRNCLVWCFNERGEPVFSLEGAGKEHCEPRIT